MRRFVAAVGPVITFDHNPDYVKQNIKIAGIDLPNDCRITLGFEFMLRAELTY
ncbi:MAG: hypothetical protein LBC27_09360 [Spirochaetaceae bacterium]|nr:hypothetical protein [Spirochaetaceae bacterium]